MPCETIRSPLIKPIEVPHSLEPVPTGDEPFPPLSEQYNLYGNRQDVRVLTYFFDAERHNQIFSGEAGGQFYLQTVYPANDGVNMVMQEPTLSEMMLFLRVVRSGDLREGPASSLLQMQVEARVLQHAVLSEQQGNIVRAEALYELAEKVTQL